MNQLLIAEQVAEILSCSPSTIYSWAADGTIPSYKIKRMIRFKLEDIEDWLNRQRKKADEGGKRIKECPSNTKTHGIDNILRKAIDEVKGNAV